MCGEAAAASLGNIGAEEAAHALVKALEDEEYQVWEAARRHNSAVDSGEGRMSEPELVSRIASCAIT